MSDATPVAPVASELRQHLEFFAKWTHPERVKAQGAEAIISVIANYPPVRELRGDAPVALVASEDATDVQAFVGSLEHTWHLKRREGQLPQEYANDFAVEAINAWQAVAPVAGEEVEAACHELAAVGREMDALGMDRDIFAEAAAMLRKLDTAYGLAERSRVRQAELIRKLDARHKLDVKLYGELGAEWREAYDKLDAERAVAPVASEGEK